MTAMLLASATTFLVAGSIWLIKDMDKHTTNEELAAKFVSEMATNSAKQKQEV
jgi:hypothetical protein